MHLASYVLHNFLQLQVEEVSKLLNVFHAFLKGKEFLFSCESSNGFWKWLIFLSCINSCSTKSTVTNKITIVVSYSIADSWSRDVALKQNASLHRERTLDLVLEHSRCERHVQSKKRKQPGTLDQMSAQRLLISISFVLSLSQILTRETGTSS